MELIEIDSPELLSRDEYLAARRRNDPLNGLTHPEPDSIFWTGNAIRRHGEHVRKAVEEKRPVHAYNRKDYIESVPALFWYELQSSIAVYAQWRKDVWPTLADWRKQKAEDHRKLVAMEDAEESKRLFQKESHAR